MHIAFTQPWADALHEIINADEHYAQVGKSWVGSVAMVMTPPAPAVGFPDGGAIELDLAQGRCHGARACLPPDVVSGTSLGATLEVWRELVEQNQDPMIAVARGKVKLLAGSLGMLMLHARAANALVACSRKVPTLWTR
jgi:putative sterol carrier protein